jgi:hypothetical protein
MLSGDVAFLKDCILPSLAIAADIAALKKRINPPSCWRSGDRFAKVLILLPQIISDNRYRLRESLPLHRRPQKLRAMQHRCFLLDLESLAGWKKDRLSLAFLQ